MGRTLSAGLQQRVVQAGHQHAKSQHLHNISTLLHLNFFTQAHYLTDWGQSAQHYVRWHTLVPVVLESLSILSDVYEKMRGQVTRDEIDEFSHLGDRCTQKTNKLLGL
jgi:hypothetical protein